MNKPKPPQAFPMPLAQEYGYDGMTLHEYFMAHAPADPQPWFKPKISERPALPKRQELTDKERSYWENSEDSGDSMIMGGSGLNDEEFARVVSFSKRWTEARQASDEWELEKLKQTYVQWPAAWADEMMKQRG